MNIYRRNICLSLVSVMLSGCVIPIHVDDDEPYTSVRKKLLGGRTTKEQILELLGEPSSYEQGSEWVYTAPEIEWELLTGSGYPVLTDKFGQQHFLILHFDERDVIADYKFESVEPKTFFCTPSLYCHDGAYGVMRLASNETASRVKELTATEDQCGLYLRGSWASNISVILDGERKGSHFLEGSFFFWNINPGSHRIVVHPAPKVDPASLSLDCKKNELIFVDFHFGWWGPKNSTLSIVDKDKVSKWFKSKNTRLIYSESGWFVEVR